MDSVGQLVTTYIDRVVNHKDLSAVDEFVSPGYVGSGPEWATTYSTLRQFYLDQYRDRPDWHIEVQEMIELGESVVVRALAGGRVQVDGVVRTKRLEWLTHYVVADELIREINILSVVPRGIT